MQQEGWLARIEQLLSGATGGKTELGIAVVAALLGAMVGFALLLLDMRRRSGAAVMTHQAEDEATFLFRGRELRAANRAGHALLGRLGLARREATRRGSERLMEFAAARDRDLGRRLAGLLDRGEPMSGEFTGEDYRHLEIRGIPQGGLALVVLRDATAARRGQIAAEARLRALEEEVRSTGAMVDWLPVAMWRRDATGRILWANASYRRLAAASGSGEVEPPPDLFARPADLDLSSGAEIPARRLSLWADAGEPRWFDVTEAPDGLGGTHGAATDAGPIVRAEAALKRFVETLTETFAHLPTGLAVFDKNRRLGLFNPAISDILKLDPAWLATRPSLRDFLERLRENRHMPDQKDFMAWRRKLTALERDAEAASYEEDWVLPSGQTLHVTGRPHPQGAIAFLFEDISSAVMLESRYRDEIESLRAVLDKLPEAVALFRPDGMLAFANTAFPGVWGFQPGTGGPRPHVSQLIERWAAVSEPTPIWGRLQDFATGQEARSPWAVRILLADGRILQARFAPLPDGSTLASFCEETERERMQAELREAVADLETERSLFLDREAEARARIEQGLERISKLSDRLDPALGAEMADMLTGLRGGLRGLPRPEAALEDGEARSVSAHELPALLRAVQKTVTARELALTTELSVEGELPGLSPRRLRQVLHNLLTEATAASALAVHLSLARESEVLVATATAPMPEDRDGGMGLAGAILQRLARLEGGTVTVETDPARTNRILTCRLPLRGLAPGVGKGVTVETGPGSQRMG